MGGSAIECRIAKGLAPPGLRARSAACNRVCRSLRQVECVQVQGHAP